MSGLVAFFRPSNGGNKKRKVPTDNSNNNDNDSYQQSTASLWQQRQQFANNNRNNDNHPGSPHRNSSVLLPNTNGGDTARNNTSAFPTTRLAISYNDWKVFLQGWINVFMNHRLLVQHDHHDDNDEEVGSPVLVSRRSSGKDVEESKKDDSASAEASPPPPLPPKKRFRMQKSFSASLPDHDQSEELQTLRQEEDEKDTSTVASSSNRTASIELHVPPHVLETFGTARRFKEVDLHTSELDLGKLRVLRWTPLRRTRRAARLQSNQPQTIYTYHKEWCSMSLRPSADDGPLSVLYTACLGLEVEQVQVPSLTQLEALAERATQSTQPVTRLSVFLYNCYARALGVILDETLGNSRKYGNKNNMSLQIELRHVPPACILPDTDTALNDWFTRHSHCKYCVCLGDDSLMNVDHVRIRFDGSRNVLDNDDTEQPRLVHGGQTALVVSWMDLDDNQNHKKILKQWEVAAWHEGYLKELKPPPLDVEQEPPPPLRTSTTSTTEATDHRKAPPPEPAPPAAATTQQDARGASAEVAETEPRQRDVATEQQQTTPSNPVRTSLGAKATTGGDYEPHYHKLAELKAYHQQIAPTGTAPVADVYGVVLGIGTPSRTKRGDWMISLVLMDDSRYKESCGDGGEDGENEENGEEEQKDKDDSDAQTPIVVANLFCKQKEALPQVWYCGDVLRLHRCKVQLWNGEIQLMGGKPASYLVYRKHTSTATANNANSVITHSPSKRCTVAPQDEERFPQLWDWGQAQIRSYPTMRPQKIWSLADVQFNVVGSGTGNDGDDEEGDMTVMVAAVLKLEHRTEQDPIGYLRIWDGTGSAPSDPFPRGTSEVQAQHLQLHGDPPSAALIRLNQAAQQLQNLSQQQQDDTELLTIDAVIGFVTNVAVWEPEQWELLEQARMLPGTFLRLRNVKYKPLPFAGDSNDNNKKCLMMDKKCHLTPLPSTTYEVAQLIRNHNQRLRKKDVINPNSGVRPLDNRDPAETVDAEEENDDNNGTGVISDLSKFQTLQTTSCFVGTICILDTSPSLLRNKATEESLFQILNKELAVGLKVYQERQQGSHHGKPCGDSNPFELGVMVLPNSQAADKVRELLAHNQPARGGIVSSGIRRVIIRKTKWKATIISTIWEEDNSFYFVLDKLEEEV